MTRTHGFRILQSALLSTAVFPELNQVFKPPGELIKMQILAQPEPHKAPESAAGPSSSAARMRARGAPREQRGHPAFAAEASGYVAVTQLCPQYSGSPHVVM